MGLILNVLQSLYLGSLCVLLAPVTFIQRPVIWLRAIHNYRGHRHLGEVVPTLCQSFTV
jgi:hypothetical protein